MKHQKSSIARPYNRRRIDAEIENYKSLQSGKRERTNFPPLLLAVLLGMGIVSLVYILGGAEFFREWVRHE